MAVFRAVSAGRAEVAGAGKSGRRTGALHNQRGAGREDKRVTQKKRSFGGVTTIMLGVLGLAAVSIVALVLMRSGIDDGSSGNSADIFVAKRGNFDVTIPCSGELAAQNQIEIRNKLESRAVITHIVPEGTTVTKGELLLTLAEEEILTKIKDAEDEVKTAEAALIAAQASYDIQMSERDSELAQADVNVQLAELALQAWEKGELLSMRQQLATALKTAEINFERMTEKYDESLRLLGEGFISKDEADRDRIELLEAEAAFKKAELDEQVYEDYTFLQEQKKYNSDLEQAKAEKDRVEQRHKAELEQLRADVESKKHQLASRQERLQVAQREHSYCKIMAPSDGLVVYNSSLEDGGWRGMEEGPPQVGTELRPNERVMVLPDTTQMMAVVKVNEALSGMVKPGQRVTVKSDAVPDATMVGEVQSVGVLAQQGGWRDPNRREYSVKVAILGDYPRGIKPSMRCEATIYVDRVSDVLHVPVQAVFRSGRESLVYVPQGGGFAERQVALGRSSELAVEVTDGLTSGERVLLRKPGLSEVVSRLPRHESPDEDQGADDDMFGTEAGAQQASGDAAPATPMGGGRPGEGTHDGSERGGPGKVKPAGAQGEQPSGAPQPTATADSRDADAESSEAGGEPETDGTAPAPPAEPAASRATDSNESKKPA
jgi:HlyD family secretion protein